MLVLCQTTTCPGSSSENNPSVLALCHMGPRFSGTLQNGPRRLQAHPSGGGQVHKVDRSSGRCYRHVEGGSKVHGRHHPPLRVPNSIVTDLGTAFTGSDFWDFCQDSLIDVYYSSVAHPRCNGQVERANGMVLQGTKDRIFGDASQTPLDGWLSCLT
jgi:hypothetical protein